MNVLLAANERACPGVDTVLFSLLKHNKNINITIFTGTIDIDNNMGVIYNHRKINKTQEERLRKIVAYFDSNSTIRIIDVAKEFDTVLKRGGVNEQTSFTPHSMLRLLIDLYYDNSIHDLLYLDSDIIVTDNIETEYKMYTTSDHAYSAYSAPAACDYKGEMNSGVMFFNLDKCREINFFKRARHNLINHVYKYPDQMAIRDVCDPNPIPTDLNFFDNLEDMYYMPKIIHFTDCFRVKVYNAKSPYYFFKMYPQFKYIYDGIHLIDQLNLKV